MVSRRAEVARELELLVRHVDRDDRLAPAIAQPWIVLRPTPPAPNTTQVEPGSTFAVLSAAPAPVITAQPTIAALSMPIEGSILITLSRCSVAYSVITPTPAKWLSVAPFESLKRLVPSGSVIVALADTSQSCGLPITQ